MTHAEMRGYCKRCAATVGRSDEECRSCGALLDGVDYPLPVTDAPSDRWWLGLVVHPVTALLAFLLGFAAGLWRTGGDLALASTLSSLSGGVELLGLVLGVVLAPLAVHYDGRYLAATRADWTPSRWYYLAFFPYLGIPVSLVYVARRRRGSA